MSARPGRQNPAPPFSDGLSQLFLNFRSCSVIIMASYEFAASHITRETGRKTKESLDQLAG